MIDLDALQAAAEAATPGPWTADCCSAANMVYGPSDSIGVDAVRADAEFIAAWNPAVALDFLAEYRRVLAELERSKRGGKTLGEMIKQQCDDIVKITDSAHLIDETGDGDWGAVWERGFDMRAQLDSALARIARVESVRPTWPRGMYGAPQDMLSLRDLRQALTEGEPRE